ncbi:MAG TPA: energy-coupling factor transporter transmembrane component T [Anaerolineae bacterium]|nr:energy-coupling factor transporter transmembrane component T [Anaerolineae bacterium]HQI84315.1 energy-coupling factor transporter transmembrane component T [Anaerolineae bacterium]
MADTSSIAYPISRITDRVSRKTTGRLQRLTYQPGASFLHRLHPVVKLAWLTGSTAALFILQQPTGVLIVLALAGIAFPLNNLKIHKVRGLRLFAVTALLLFLTQVFLTNTETPLLQLGPLHITEGGIAKGIYTAGRLLSVILLSYLFVLTTEPNDLGYALMRAGLPYRYGFMLITALHLVPLFEQEAQTVYQAQLARGIAYDRGGLKRFFTLARQFFLPLLVSAMSKVDALAVSMEGRCFGKYPRRTFLREVTFTRRDGVALGVLVVGMIVLLALRLWGVG